MPAYIMTLCKITDVTDSFKSYAAQSAALISKHGGRYIIHGTPLPGATAALDGWTMVGLEFPSVAALDGYKADAADIIPLRAGAGLFETAAYEGGAQA